MYSLCFFHSKYYDLIVKDLYILMNKYVNKRKETFVLLNIK